VDAVEVVGLSPELEPAYLVCLEGWSDEMTEAGDHKARWYAKMRDRGLRVKLAVMADEPIGMIQYIPIEESPALGSDLYMILCIWVHGHDSGVGDQQGYGAGEALLAAAEADARELGAKGIGAWGLAMPTWMRASWFKKRGYQKADRDGIRLLLWKPFVADAVAPRWIKPTRKPSRIEGRVAVTAFVNGWCPASNLVYERARRAAACFGSEVVLETVDTSEQADMIACGYSDGVFVDGKPVQRGAPPSYESILTKIQKRVDKL
jgi:GNAT superfamily N-acetyltransferase